MLTDDVEASSSLLLDCDKLSGATTVPMESVGPEIADSLLSDLDVGEVGASREPAEVLSLVHSNSRYPVFDHPPKCSNEEQALD